MASRIHSMSRGVQHEIIARLSGVRLLARIKKIGMLPAESSRYAHSDNKTETKYILLRNGAIAFTIMLLLQDTRQSILWRMPCHKVVSVGKVMGIGLTFTIFVALGWRFYFSPASMMPNMALPPAWAQSRIWRLWASNGAITITLPILVRKLGITHSINCIQ